MGSRFGAANPAHAMLTKIRWIVGALVVVIVILLVALLLIVKNDSSKKNEPVTPPIATDGIVDPPVEVIVAARDIKVGQRLTRDLIHIREEPASRVPDKALLARNSSLYVDRKYANVDIFANMMLLEDHFSDTAPGSGSRLAIPPGYRAVTIYVDTQTGVEGWAKPESRVDILWTFEERSERKVAAIVKYVKILSVGGMVSSAKSENAAPITVQGKTSITLLVTAEDAQRVALAQTMGTLSLSLVGSEESDQGGIPGKVIGKGDLTGATDNTAEVEPNVDGVLYTENPATGEVEKWILVNGRWKRDTNF